MWKCPKCNKMIDDCIDTDYHYNTEHPNFSDPYLSWWWSAGRPGMSPYD